jgi:hypothetical protein
MRHEKIMENFRRKPEIIQGMIILNWHLKEIWSEGVGWV